MKNRIKAIAYSMIAAIAALLLAFVPYASAADMIDVSSWQTGINVTTSGAQIVVAKATEGVNYTNPDCDRVVQDALNAGQGVGVYHFAHTENDARREAQHFIDNTRGYIGKKIVPILDWEPSAPWNTSWALTWLQTVKAAWDTKPIIYMNQSTENAYDWSTVVAGDYGLWIAAYTLGYTPIYGFNPPSAQPTLHHWPFAVAWQYTSTGYVGDWNGALDLSVVYGDLNTWNAYANSRQAAPTPAPKPTPQPNKPDTTCNTNCVIIQSGQYVSMFWSDWWNVTVPSGNPSIVYPGDKICHNNGSNTATTSRTYVVQSGDTLSGIASRLGVNMYNITGYSSGNMNLIYPGETLYY
jgi:GH25 family lysozyme M1 (1,4-beta-N-acetylmuramidase)